MHIEQRLGFALIGLLLGVAVPSRADQVTRGVLAGGPGGFVAGWVRNHDTNCTPRIGDPPICDHEADVYVTRVDRSAAVLDADPIQLVATQPGPVDFWVAPWADRFIAFGSSFRSFIDADGHVSDFPVVGLERDRIANTSAGVLTVGHEGSTIELALFDRDGQTLRPTRQLAVVSSDVSRLLLVGSGDRALVAWSDAGGRFAVRVDAEGVPLDHTPVPLRPEEWDPTHPAVWKVDASSSGWLVSSSLSPPDYGPSLASVFFVDPEGVAGAAQSLDSFFTSFAPNPTGACELRIDSENDGSFLLTRHRDAFGAPLDEPVRGNPATQAVLASDGTDCLALYGDDSARYVARVPDPGEAVQATLLTASAGCAMAGTAPSAANVFVLLVGLAWLLRRRSGVGRSSTPL